MPYPDKGGTQRVPLSGFLGGEPMTIESLEPDPADVIDCDDYRAHQSLHVRDGEGWRCLRCHPGPVQRPKRTRNQISRISHNGG